MSAVPGSWPARCAHLSMIPRLHAHVVGHPVVEAYRPPAGWRWCYFDETYI
ncbi:MAG TPA: hypothetical protein VMJ65_05610 [Solirubrobacteraceae bacterium]|nr:hypothetical protein [Solirubrobacteraceae bacterium]